MSVFEKPASFEVGVAKKDITPDCIGVGLMGWGDACHVVKGVRQRLYARAAVIKNRESSSRLIFVCAELCFITEALRQAVFERLTFKFPHLKIRDEELMLTATHTHNAPGGHSRYLLYNLTVPGFQPRILETYTDGIVRAIEAAFSRLTPAVLRLGSGRFDRDSKVAFNRSLEAWRRNPESREGEEIDREMTLLRFDSTDGRPLGCINWFPVHATSIHRDCHYIHSDNKGVAAELFEKSMASGDSDGFVSMFAQGAAGDVTPNFVKHPGLQDVRGPHRDDEKNCEFNAQLQLALAQAIFKDLAGAPALGGDIEGVIERHDFSRVEVAEDLVGGRRDVRTGPAAIGCNFLKGTEEGHGAPDALVFLATALARVKRYFQYFGIRLRGKKIPPPWSADPIHGPKICFMESGRGRIFGVSQLAGFFLPGWLHPTIKNLKLIWLESAQQRRPFTPQILPLQIVKLGALVFVAVPAEFTTVAGRRLRQTVGEALASELKVDRVILCGYSNAYSGYVTTYEEYQVQAYEGASTHFGMWTLAGYQTLFRKICREWLARSGEQLKRLCN